MVVHLGDCNYHLSQDLMARGLCRTESTNEVGISPAASAVSNHTQNIGRCAARLRTEKNLWIVTQLLYMHIN